MPLLLVRNDIARMQVDAIVNPTNSRLVPGGGADAAIHRAAGPELARICSGLAPLMPGQAVLTGGCQLPCRYVIHTVGPRWYDGRHREEAVLRQCYRESLKLAEVNACRTLALPLIASGALGVPKERVMAIAAEEIRRFLETSDLTVYLVVYDSKSFALSRQRFQQVQAFIDDTYVESRPVPNESQFRSAPCSPAPFGSVRSACLPSEGFGAAAPVSLEALIANLDEGFSQMLFRKIDEKGLTDAQCYKKANIDRKLFSKIRSPGYKPSKPTVIALAMALELSLEETRDLLMKAGFALSHSNKFDVIIEYCIVNGIYDILRVNEILFAFDQSLLGNC